MEYAVMLAAEIRLRFAPEFVIATNGALIPPVPAVKVVLPDSGKARVAGESEFPPGKLIASPAVAFNAKEYAKVVFAALRVISCATFQVPPKILIAVLLLGPMVRSPLPLILNVAACTVPPSIVIVGV